jgi:adenylate cyclase
MQSYESAVKPDIEFVDQLEVDRAFEAMSAIFDHLYERLPVEMTTLAVE